MSPTTFSSLNITGIAQLLDRLDPMLDGVCDVSGCIHNHPHHEPRLSAAGVGTV